MADRIATLAKARKELEEMYLGIPDDSVNLTFGDLVDVKTHLGPRPLERRISGPIERRMSGPLEPIDEVTNKSTKEVDPKALAKLPSLDFSRALESTAKQHRAAANERRYQNAIVGHPFIVEKHQVNHHQQQQKQQQQYQLQRHYHEREVYDDRRYEDISAMSIGTSVTMSAYQDGGGKRRRAGIPHSNICSICSNYVYMCRHRCLVCGRAYCKQCVGIGMGEMTEGRKCIECLGKKFSQRYIQRAGQVSCCMRFRYSSEVIQQELKWAEKGPRKTADRRYGQSGLMSTSVSPITPRSPRTPRSPTRSSPNQGPPSFVLSSPYSPYSSTAHHPMPF